MSATELSLLAFAGCNLLRLVAYAPQIIKLAKDPRAAAGFCHATWLMFAAANASTVAYAVVVLDDSVMAGFHASSTVCCFALMGLAGWRQGRLPLLRRSALG